MPEGREGGREGGRVGLCVEDEDEDEDARVKRLFLLFHILSRGLGLLRPSWAVAAVSHRKSQIARFLSGLWLFCVVILSHLPSFHT